MALFNDAEWQARMARAKAHLDATETYIANTRARAQRRVEAQENDAELRKSWDRQRATVRAGLARREDEQP